MLESVHFLNESAVDYLKTSFQRFQFELWEIITIELIF